MEAIRKIVKVKNSSPQISNLKSFNNQTVEIIIFPISEKKQVEKVKTNLTKTTPGKEFLKLKGIWKDRIDIQNSVDYVQELRKKIATRKI